MSYDKRYLLRFFGATAAGLLVIFGAGFYAEPLSGDLTRVGGWTEREFGWTEPLPEMPIDGNFPDMKAAGILVLGDSFSLANIWQTMVGRERGLNVASHNYEQFVCIEQWLEMLESNGVLAGRTVIVESLERFFPSRFGNIGTCRKSKSRDKSVVKPFEAFTHGEIPTSRRTGGEIPTDVVYLLKVLKNAVLEALLGSDATIHGVAVNAPLTSRDLFSNRRSDRILYYYEDDAEGSWSDEQIGKAVYSISAIQRRIEAAEGRFIFVLVPNKSSVYARFIVGRPDADRYTTVIRRLGDAGVATVDMLAPFRGHAEKEVDFYLPDDTHVSTKGYRVLGEVISGEMKKMAAR
ncbi:alginate O-acetyltransferase AlgX-related protein [Methylococcus capsulatus]|jgi:hypothetical protein|uniref:alginate O-acetyltransferase AlgX-related protein n=2 Tax=Methylococcus capsulatus TaxID=414 RepID=UPI0020181235|nr:hypothetical protein [Methylococcus capsulatus]UQN13625.1 hypothetical protein M3M30_07230 [Methylococcus capsulatus]